MRYAEYAKFVAAIAAAALSAFVAAATDGTVSSPEWVNVAIAAVGAAGVLAAPNVPGARYTKAVLAVLTAGLTVLVSAIIGGITLTEWLQIGAAAAGAVGVFRIPNEPASSAEPTPS